MRSTSIAAIDRHLRIFDVFRNLDIEMPIGQIVFFLTAAKLEGGSLREIAQASGAKMTTASRYLSNLSPKDAYRPAGLNLLIARENPMNRRMKVIRLTDEGNRVLAALS
jgi:DNA-binding MarR family transcriptional regulator